MGESLQDDTVKVHEISIGFLTALVTEELVPCEDVLTDRGWREQVPPNRKLKRASIREWRKVIGGVEVTAYSAAISAMGQTRSALETLTFLSRCNPDIVVLCGIAGSLEGIPKASEKKPPDIEKRDVVIATALHWRMQNKISDGEPCDEYRASNFPSEYCDADTVTDIGRFVNQNYRDPHINGFKVVPGEIFTWDYVINSDRKVTSIKNEFPGSLCVEMEGGAFTAAVKRHSKVQKQDVEHFVVRGISDYARKKDSVPADRTAASRNAASVAVHLGEQMAQRLLDRL